MQITPFGTILLPFAIWAFFVCPDCLFPLTVLLSTFDAASVINVRVGGDLVGLRPYYFLALLLLIRFAGSFGEWVQFVRSRAKPKSNCARVLLAFWATVVLGALALPKLFAGIGVLDPRVVDDPGLAYVLLGVVKPLSWTYRNITQPFFVGINIVLVVWAGAASGRSELVRRSARALKAGVALAALAVFLQLVSDFSGNWFPYQFFNGNPGYARGYSQKAGAWHRLNSTFTEPSFAGGFLAAGALAMWAMGARNGPARMIACLASLACVMTTATTGIVALVAGITIMFLASRRRQGRGQNEIRKIRNTARWMAVGLAAVLAGVIAVLPADFKGALKVMTLEKLFTPSFVSRAGAAYYSVLVTIKTYGLGVGLLGNRSADMCTYLLSNTGVIGFTLFGTFSYLIIRQAFTSDQRNVYGFGEVFGWFYIGLLIAQVIGIPDVSWPPLWVAAALAMLVGGERGMERLWGDRRGCTIK